MEYSPARGLDVEECGQLCLALYPRFCELRTLFFGSDPHNRSSPVWVQGDRSAEWIEFQKLDRFVAEYQDFAPDDDANRGTTTEEEEEEGDEGDEEAPVPAPPVPVPAPAPIDDDDDDIILLKRSEGGEDEERSPSQPYPDNWREEDEGDEEEGDESVTFDFCTRPI